MSTSVGDEGRVGEATLRGDLAIVLRRAHTGVNLYIFFHHYYFFRKLFVSAAPSDLGFLCVDLTMRKESPS